MVKIDDNKEQGCYQRHNRQVSRQQCSAVAERESAFDAGVSDMSVQAGTALGDESTLTPLGSSAFSRAGKTRGILLWTPDDNFRFFSNAFRSINEVNNVPGQHRIHVQIGNVSLLASPLQDCCSVIHLGKTFE